LTVTFFKRQDQVSFIQICYNTYWTSCRSCWSWGGFCWRSKYFTCHQNRFTTCVRGLYKEIDTWLGLTRWQISEDMGRYGNHVKQSEDWFIQDQTQKMMGYKNMTRRE